MKKHLLLCALPFLAACSQQEAAEPEASALTLHEVMKAEIDVNADALWEISNAAIGDAGGLNPAKLNDEQWTQIADLADKVAAGAAKLAAMDPITVAASGVTISDSNVVGGHTAAQVQEAVDRDPQGLRDLAQALHLHMTDIATAARAHDAATAGPLIDELDGVCENCHLEFWYPEQADLVRQLRDSGVVDADHPGAGPAAEPSQ